MAIEQFTCNDTAEFLDLVDFPINGLLQDFIDHFKISGEVCTLQASRKVDINIEIGYKDDRSFFMAVYFDQFLDVFNSDTGKVYPDIWCGSLYIR
ncbi:MAG: hypothetical protein A4E34_01618 [Methanoregula sp. PtaU1.Bin006]|nr:MAG: hypothetical protein A4E33_02760 [Methanoregula sp. PtaB.Bin085]OPY34031.1 MAG: hypothetical protein A4E34_01618 [Methanoregula sp. PtaU1.Bin006]